MSKDSPNKSIKLSLILITVALLHHSAATSLDNEVQNCDQQPDGTILAIQEDCSSYTHCLKEQPQVINCPEGQGFNAELLDCAEYSKSICARTETTPDVPLHCSDNKLRLSNVLACVGRKRGILEPYPGNCTKYLICDCLVPTVQQCSDGYHFDRITSECKPSQEVDCSRNAGWGTNCQAPPGMQDDICQLQPTGYLKRYPYDCNSYIECSHGCPVMQRCQEGQQFNTVLTECDSPENAQCKELPMPNTTEATTTATEEDSTTAEGSGSSTTEEDSTTEDGTITEENSTTEESSTTEENLTTDESSTTEKDSITEEDSTTENSSTTEDSSSTEEVATTTTEETSTTTEETEETTTSNTTESSTTAEASSSTAEPETTEASISMSTTDQPSSSTTTESTTSTTEQTTTTTTEASTTTTEDLTTTTEASTTTTETSTTTTEASTTTTEVSTTEATATTAKPCHQLPGIDRDICRNVSPGTMLSYPYNCTAYILCESSTCARLQYCSTDKVFNAELGICDTTDSLSCIELQHPTTATPEPSTIVPPVTTTTEQDINTPMTSTTTTPSLPPNVNPLICQGMINGMLPYAEDCSKYLKCSQGKVSLENCPSGWLFDANYLMCDQTSRDVCFTDATTTPAITTTTTVPTTTTTQSVPQTPNEICQNELVGSKLPYKQDCSKYVYCNQNGGYINYCNGKNNYFDPETQACGTNVDSNACKQDTTSSTTAEICQNQPTGSKFPYQQDCSKYVYCRNNAGYINYCNDNSYFDPTTKTCGRNVAANACKQENNPASTTTTVPTTTTTQSVPQTPNEICQNQLVGSKLPYKQDCSKYVYCNQNGGYINYCNGKNNYFDPETQTCGTNVDSNACKQDTTSSTTAEICQNQPTGSKFPYQQDCSKYVYCRNNAGYINYCNDNSYFDPTTKTCGRNVAANACKPIYNAATVMASQSVNLTFKKASVPETPNEICANQLVGSKFPYKQDCSKYVYCSQNAGYVNHCNGKNTYYDPETENCGANVDPNACKQDAVSSTSAEVCKNQLVGSKFPYKQDCSKYVYCRGNIGYVNYCNDDTYYDPTTKKCAANVSPNACKQENNPATTTTTTVPTTTTTQSVPQTPNEICQNQLVGSKFPYKQDCSKYVYCSQNAGYVNHCNGKNNYFDPETQTCGTNVDSNACKQDTSSATTAEICQNQPTGSKFAYQQDCSKYVYCRNNAGYINYCNDNSYFDPTTKTCGRNVAANACKQENNPATTAATVPTTTTTQNVPQTPNEICQNQLVGSKFPYKQDCSKYVYCSQNAGYVNDCNGKNNYFDPETQTCGTNVDSNACKQDTSSATTAEICQNQPTGSKFPYQQDCSKYVYCRNNAGYINYCNDNSYFDPTTKTCGRNVAVNACKPIYNAATVIASQSVNLAIKKASVPETPNEICANQLVGSKFPYKQDCSKYVYCSQNAGYVNNCNGKNTYYDPETENCGANVHPNACKQDAVSSTSAEVCKNQLVGSKFPYKQDCSKYVYCRGNIGYVNYCNDDTYYNPITKKCAANVSPNACKQENNPATTSQPIVTTTEIDLTTIPSTTGPISQEHGLCGNYTGGELIEYPGNCQKYISCIAAAPVAFSCDYNYYFNVQLQQCVAGLCEGMQPIQPPPSFICSGLNAGDTEANPSDCQLYYQCLGNNGFMPKTCLSGEYFNPLSGQCSAEVSSDYCQQDFGVTNPTQSTTTAAAVTTTSVPITTAKPLPNICSDVIEGYMIAYPQSCTKYIVCQSPIPEAYNCADGLAFSSISQACINQEQSDCNIVLMKE